MSYITFSLRKFIADVGEVKARAFLSTFVCSKESDAEAYLRNNSVEFENNGISRTYLLLERNNSEKDVIKGYFTLTIKCFKIDKMQEQRIPNDLRTLFNEDRGIAQAYLLGQLAKADDAEDGLGKIMIDRVLEIFKKSHDTVGCRVVRLDCKDALIRYYEKCGFIHIGKLDKELNQMVMIL